MKYGPAGGRQVASSFGQKFEAKSRLRVGCDGGLIMARVARVVPWVIAAAAVAADAPARAQSNLDAGKSAAQIFADTCNACHRSPREVRPTSAAFLREHYTTGGRAPHAGRGPGGLAGSRPRQRPSDARAGSAVARRGHRQRDSASASLRECGSGQSADCCCAGRRCCRDRSAASRRGSTAAAERHRSLRGIAPRRRRP